MYANEGGEWGVKGCMDHNNKGLRELETLPKWCDNFGVTILVWLRMPVLISLRSWPPAFPKYSMMGKVLEAIWLQVQRTKQERLILVVMHPVGASVGCSEKWSGWVMQGLSFTASSKHLGNPIVPYLVVLQLNLHRVTEILPCRIFFWILMGPANSAPIWILIQILFVKSTTGTIHMVHVSKGAEKHDAPHYLYL